MDVQCERCKTEYEFDDALVSGRGTTVRCTQCGHQFKVRRADADGPEDKWIVTTGAGQTLTYVTLRELQRAIMAKQVNRGDVLTHGQSPGRRLASIAELEPFFEGKGSSSRPSPAERFDVLPARAPQAPRIPREMTDQAGPQLPKRPPSFEGNTVRMVAPTPGPPRVRMNTLRPDESGVAPPPVDPSPAPYAGAGSDPEPSTLRRGGGQNAAPAEPAVRPEFSSPLPPPTVPVRNAAAQEEMMVAAMRQSMTDEVYEPPRRRRVFGWVVAVALLGGAGALGFVVARPYFARFAPSATPTAADPRVQEFLKNGERALSDGNLDVAKENFDKASALAEKNPEVLLDIARLAASRADVDWLKLRLLPPEASDDQRATRQTLDEESAGARKAADDALAAAPNDQAAIRAKIDALRIAGERDAARGYVSKIIGNATQPETAYVLAALDLAEPEPLWSTVVDRLRLAASGEGNAGRARAVLVYALARSGDVAFARAELEKLAGLSRPYPLLGLLRTYVAKAKDKVDGGALALLADAAPPRIDLSALPSSPLTTAPVSTDFIPPDSRAALTLAHQALRRGDSGRARTLFDAIVSRNPSDSEALAGLGDIARSSGDSAGAISYYKRALAVNPSYLPAMLGLADASWSSGDHATAVRLYREIVDRFPEGTYPGYVKQRAEGGAPVPQPSSGPTAAPTESSAPPPAPTATATAAPTATAPAASPSAP